MRVEAHAKVNLTLEVFGMRVDGYHALRSVVMPISLADTLEIDEAEEIACDTGYADDLCVKAAKVLEPSRGARIRVTKRIPVGGGLGGGSADAAATLIALNELWGLGKKREELAEIGAQVGSDVPALVLGGAVLMEGRGECVSRLPAPVLPLNMVLVSPGVESSTREVYARCTPRSFDGHSPTVEMIEALSCGDLRRIAAALANDLQEAAVRLHPGIADVLVSLRAAGALGAMMSGSGSSAFGLVADRVAAERLAAEMEKRGYSAWAVKSVV